MYRSIFFPEHRYKVTSYLKGILKVIVILVDIKKKRALHASLKRDRWLTMETKNTDFKS